MTAQTKVYHGRYRKVRAVVVYLHLRTVYSAVGVGFAVKERISRQAQLCTQVNMAIYFAQIPHTYRWLYIHRLGRAQLLVIVAARERRERRTELDTYPVLRKGYNGEAQ